MSFCLFVATNCDGCAVYAGVERGKLGTCGVMMMRNGEADGEVELIWCWSSFFSFLCLES